MSSTTYNKFPAWTGTQLGMAGPLTAIGLGPPTPARSPECILSDLHNAAKRHLKALNTPSPLRPPKSLPSTYTVRRNATSPTPTHADFSV